MGRFEERLDSSILAVERAKILSNEVAALQNDANVVLSFRVPEGLQQEAIDWLKDNQLTYTDIDVDFKRLSGTWRTVGFKADGNVVQQEIALGYYTSINWDVARLLQDKYNPAGGTSADAPTNDYSQSKERAVVYEFPYFAEASVDEAISALDTTKTDLGDPSGTWYLIDATSEKQRDGTHTIRALYANTSAFTLKGRNAILVAGGTTTYSYFGVPKQVAQAICDYYTQKGDSVRPSYSPGSGLVDITVFRSSGTTETVSGKYTERACLYNETTSYYFGASALPDLSAPAQGIIYSLQGVRYEEDGTYSYQLVTRTAVPFETTDFVAEVSTAATTTENILLNQAAYTQPSVEVGHIKSLDISKNQDCTYNLTERDREISNQTGNGYESAALAATDISLNTSSTELPDEVAAQGQIISVISQPTPEGRFSTRREITTSVPTNVITGTVEASGRQTLTETKAVNQTALPAAPSAVVGHIKSRSADINRDGTFNTIERDVEISDQEGSGKTAATLSTVEIATHTSGNEIATGTITASQGVVVSARSEPTEEDKFRTVLETRTSVEAVVRNAETAVDSALADTVITSKVNKRVPDPITPATQGVISRMNKTINEDGTFNTELEVTTSTEAIVRNGIVATKTVLEEVQVTEKLNTKDVDEAGTQTTGVLTVTDRKENQDGTFNSTKRITTSTEVVDQNAEVTGINSAETVMTTRTYNDRSYTAPVNEVGKTKSQQVELNPDGTHNTILVEREAKDQTGSTELSSTLQTIYTETHTQKATEETAGSAVQKVIVRVQNTPTPEGKFQTSKETITAVEATQLNQIIQNSYLEKVTEESKKNASSVPAVATSVGVVETVQANLNQDGSFDYSKRIIESQSDIDDFVENASASAIATKTISKNSRTEPTAIAQTPGKIYTKTQRRNTDGTWDAETTEIVPTASTVGPIVIDYGGLVKRLVTIYKNQSSVIGLTVGQSIVGLNYNDFGLYDYSVVQDTAAAISSYTYYYYSRAFSVATTVTNLSEQPVATLVAPSDTYYKIGSTSISSDDSGEPIEGGLLIDEPITPIHKSLASESYAQKKWKYTVTVTAYSTPTAAATAANDTVGSVDIIQSGGMWILKTLSQELVDA